MENILIHVSSLQGFIPYCDRSFQFKPFLYLQQQKKKEEKLDEQTDLINTSLSNNV